MGISNVLPTGFEHYVNNEVWVTEDKNQPVGISDQLIFE